MMRIVYAVPLAVCFLWDLTLSSIAVARAVLSPRKLARPRLVIVPITARSDAGITLIANYITLTPGTLTVDVSPDRGTLLIHDLFAGDSGDATRAGIQGRHRAQGAKGDRAMIIETGVTGVLGMALTLTVLCLIGALVAAAYRLLAGPTLADRVVALDMISVLLVVFLVVFREVSGVNAYVYVAIGLALIAFLATVAFANYIDRTRGDSDEASG